MTGNPPYWQPQGWYGPTQLINTHKAALLGDARVGTMLPARELPAELTDENGTEAMFGFLATELLPLPEGLKRASERMLERLLGSAL